jgi:hypothetical protein
MDPLIGLLGVLLAASAGTFFWLSLTDGRHAAASVTPAGPAVALEDLVATRKPLLPHTIRQTRLG